MINLDQVIENANEVPSLPASASRLAALFARQDWELGEVSDTVRLDPMLAGRVLRAANSAARGGAAQIGDVGQAVMRVGPGAILALALGSAARKNLDVPLDCYGMAAGDLWKHSIGAALAVECARRHCAEAPPPEAFAAALLHDIGMLILAVQMKPEVVTMLDRSRREGGRPLIESELEILGVHHGEVGGLIARHWELPPCIVEAITFHHDPLQAPTEEGRRLADYVALADHASEAANGYLGTTDPRQEPDSSLLERVGMPADRMEPLIESVSDQLDEVLARYE